MEANNCGACAVIEFKPALSSCAASNGKNQSLLQETWHKLLSNKLALFGLIIIGLFTTVAVLGALIRPDQTPDANDQVLEISRQKPGFKVDMLQVELNKMPESTSFFAMFLFGGEKLNYKNIPILDNSLNGKVYYIVSGHGGPDPGAVCTECEEDLCEDEYAYDVALRLARNLLQHGAIVHMIIKE